MNILIVTSAFPRQGPFITKEKSPPLGVGFLLAVLRDNGHKVFFIDNYLKPSNFIEENFLEKNSIDYFCVTVNTICLQDSLRMFAAANQARKNNIWNGKIIAGGPQTTVAPETIPEYVDYLVQGEGEQAILDIINGKERERMIRKPRQKELDGMPFQPWDIFVKLPYDFSCPWIDERPVFTLNTSRGCPFGCYFCSVGSIWGQQYYYFSPERIVSEVEYLYHNYGARGIYFREDNFTLDRERTRSFCELLLKKDLKIKWACETRVNNLDEDTIALMSRAGCQAFFLGVESGSEKILKLINKNISIEQIMNVVNWGKQYGIRSHCSLLVGIPGETVDDYLATRDLMRKIKPYNCFYNVFVGIPNSRLYTEILAGNGYEHKDENGILYLPGYDVKAEYFYGLNAEKTSGFRFRQRTDLDLYLISHMRIRNIARGLKRFIGSITPKKIKNLIKPLISNLGL